MASETVYPIDWSHPPPSWAVPPERLVLSINRCGLCSTGNRSFNFSMRGNHLAYAATRGKKNYKQACFISIHFILRYFPVLSKIYWYRRTTVWNRKGVNIQHSIWAESLQRWCWLQTQCATRWWAIEPNISKLMHNNQIFRYVLVCNHYLSNISARILSVHFYPSYALLLWYYQLI